MVSGLTITDPEPCDLDSETPGKSCGGSPVFYPEFVSAQVVIACPQRKALDGDEFHTKDQVACKLAADNPVQGTVIRNRYPGWFVVEAKILEMLVQDG
jgi:hypothetical protein